MFGENDGECELPKREELMKILTERLGNMFQKKEEEYEVHSALSEEFLKEHRAIGLEFGIARNKLKELDARCNLLWSKIIDSVKMYDKDFRIEGDFLMIRKDNSNSIKNDL